MAYYFLFPEKDSTIYNHPDRLHLNTGHDEILELVKEVGSSDQRHYPSRILIKFDNTEIQNVISDTIGSSIFNNGTSKVFLELTSLSDNNLTTVLNVQAFPVSQSWEEGSGRFANLPTGSNGVSWLVRDNSINNTLWPTSSFGTIGVTGSISSSQLTQGGGTYFTGSGFQASQQILNGDSLDISIDVTGAVTKQSASIFANTAYPDGIPNHGFLIKQPDSVEANTSSSFGEMQYFSTDTHTIYPPKLAFKWDDSTHNYQSSAKTSGELNVSLYRNKEEFNQNDEALFRIHVRDKYPTRAFTSTSNYLNAGYFTTSSYYSIRDAYTEEEVVPFDDDFTKLSADNEGMYFKVYMKGLQPERYYRLLFKHKNNDGVVVYDEKYHFKVVR